MYTVTLKFVADKADHESHKLEYAMPITPHASRKPILNLFFWSANSKCSSKASSWLNDDTYRWVCATVIVSSFRETEQGVHFIEMLDLLEENSVTGVRVKFIAIFNMF